MGPPLFLSLGFPPVFFPTPAPFKGHPISHISAACPPLTGPGNQILSWETDLGKEEGTGPTYLSAWAWQRPNFHPVFKLHLSNAVISLKTILNVVTVSLKGCIFFVRMHFWV